MNSALTTDYAISVQFVGSFVLEGDDLPIVIDTPTVLSISGTILHGVYSIYVEYCLF